MKKLKSLKYNFQGVLKIELEKFNEFFLYSRLTLGSFICVNSICTCNARWDTSQKKVTVVIIYLSTQQKNIIIHYQM